MKCPDCDGLGWHDRTLGQCQRCGGSGRCKMGEFDRVGKCARCGNTTSKECVCRTMLCLTCVKLYGHCGCEIDEVKKVKR